MNGGAKKVVGRIKTKLKLRYQENRVDSPVIWYFKSIGKGFYSFFDLNWADVPIN